MNTIGLHTGHSPRACLHVASSPGKVAFYDEAALGELRETLDKVGGRPPALPLEAVAARLNLHALLNQMLAGVMPLVNLDSGTQPDHLPGELDRGKSRIIVTTFTSRFQSAVKLAQSHNTGSYPSVTANRGTVPAEQRKREKTVFYQIFKQVRVASP